MRVCVLSDIHASLNGLQKVRERCRDVDAIWFLGDLFDRGEEGPRVFTLFKIWYEQRRNAGHLNAWLPGNHDCAFAWLQDKVRYPQFQIFFTSLEDQDTCRRLSLGMLPGYVSAAAGRDSEVYRELNGLKVYLTHGFPDPNEVERLMDYDLKHSPAHVNHYSDRVQHLPDFPHLWIVGHSHYQTAWLYTPPEEPSDSGWREWIPGFGSSLSGEPRWIEGDHEQDIDFGTLPAGSFMILNPGSVGYPRGVNGRRIAEYLTLDISGLKVSAQFHSIPLD